MLTHPEDEHLTLFFVPVSADSLEHSRTVMQRVGCHTYLRLIHRYHSALEKGVQFLIAVDGCSFVSAHGITPLNPNVR